MVIYSVKDTKSTTSAMDMMDEDDDIYNTSKSNGNSSPQNQPQKTVCIVTRDTGLLEVCILSDSEISVKT
jgi:hypothetical protein